MELCRIYLRLQDWDNALGMFDTVAEAQCGEYPLLRLFRGAVRLASVMAKDVRDNVLRGIPIDARFARVVARKSAARKALSAALEDFRVLAQIAGELQLREAKRVAESFSLWTELLHPDTAAAAAEALQAEMNEPKKAVANIQYAFAYLKNFDPTDLRS